MNTTKSSKIATLALLSGLILSGGASSVLLQNTDELSSNASQLVNDLVNEVTTYFQLNEILGKYYTENDTRSIQRLIILVKQPMRTSLDISTITIKISNDNDILLLGYSGHVQKYNTDGLFENTIWNQTNFSFSVIVLHDKDNSTQQHHIMNGDIAFIVIRLPEQFRLRADESLILSIIPEKGLMRTVVLSAPSIHRSNIINFGDV